MRELRALAVLLVACCAPRPSLAPSDVAAAERAALVSVFLRYEHPSQLVFWTGPPSASPILGETSLGDSLSAGGASLRELRLPVPLSTITTAEIEEHFRRNADGWEAWYQRFPGSGGIVEVTAPRVLAGAVPTAAVVVARLCGEHCRSAWRVVVKQSRDGAWNTSSIAPVKLPRI